MAVELEPKFYCATPRNPEQSPQFSFSLNVCCQFCKLPNYLKKWNPKVLRTGRTLTSESDSFLVWLALFSVILASQCWTKRQQRPTVRQAVQFIWVEFADFTMLTIAHQPNTELVCDKIPVTDNWIFICCCSGCRLPVYVFGLSASLEQRQGLRFCIESFGYCYQFCTWSPLYDMKLKFCCIS